MRMLAIDTSTHACTAALMVDNELYTQFALTPRGHTELILDMCDKVLAEGGITQQQLDVIACGRGPGSFTGVRIAAGLAQGMALALEIPIVAVSSLAAAAQHAYSEYGQDHLYVAMDARMQETYCCYYVATDDGYVIAEID
ncbi:MAG: tRNA (adenosine(37)-N6)-threonylcarbamoyltransferase complex dimerization subunit type 1 TsaB, partial [Gammaproteobacteria bacterium]|nr:tRNA (adenosine(37)-N6)-threonylcarbamoyltransferase complex dimerization subunit type 1 TsaB [Gammaproteobacteria bacterium]